MNRKWMVTIGAIVVLLVAVVGLAGCTSDGTFSGGTLEIKGNLNGQQEGIWVNGEGKVTAVPDVAILRVGVEAQAAIYQGRRDLVIAGNRPDGWRHADFFRSVEQGEMDVVAFSIVTVGPRVTEHPGAFVTIVIGNDTVEIHGVVEKTESGKLRFRGFRVHNFFAFFCF